MTTSPTLITNGDCSFFRSTLSQCKPDTDIISLKGLSCTARQLKEFQFNQMKYKKYKNLKLSRRAKDIQ